MSTMGKDDTRGLKSLVDFVRPPARKTATALRRLDLLKSAVAKASRGERLVKPEREALDLAVRAAEDEFRHRFFLSPEGCT